MEYWKPVVGYEGFYEVSSIGRIRSLDRIAKRSHSPMVLKGRVIKQRQGIKNKYWYVMMCRDGRPKLYTTHRLVALAFIPKIKGKNNVNHKNSIRTDNRIENLEWMTQKENIRHGRAVGLYTDQKQVIRLEDKKIYRSTAEAGRDVESGHGCIVRVCQGKQNHHKGFHYNYYKKGDQNYVVG